MFGQRLAMLNVRVAYWITLWLTKGIIFCKMFCLLSGGVPERSKGSDCKSDGSAFGGSNPPPSTMVKRRCCVCGCSSMVELQPSKLITWVRFPSPAPCLLGSARIAQSVERIHGKDEVISSILIVGSILVLVWAGCLTVFFVTHT